MARFTDFIVVLFLSLFLISCTRGGEQLSVKLALPIQASQSLSLERLEEIILNIHNMPGKPNPWRISYEFKDSSFNGVLEIPDVPKAKNVIIQVLGVYQSVDDEIRLAYGGKAVDLSQSLNVDIKLTSQSGSSKMLEMAGRYLNLSEPHPSGKLVAYYNPADGLPKMKIKEEKIISGWFEAFAFEYTNEPGKSFTFDFVAEIPGSNPQTLFSQLYFTEKEESGVVSVEVYEGNEKIQFDSDSRMLFKKPITMRSWGSSNETEVDGARYLAYGFFGPGVEASHKICYPTGVVESLAYAKTKNPATNQYMPLEVNLNGGGSEDEQIGVLGGGVSQTFSQHYGFLSTLDCNDTLSENFMRVQHRLLNRYGLSTLGLQLPFAQLNELSDDPNYLVGFYQEAPSGVKLKWKKAPGFGATSLDQISNFEVWSRKRENDSGGWGNSEEESCPDLAKKGFKMLASVGLEFNEAFVSQAPDGTSFSNMNWHEYDFAVCAVKQGISPKAYVGQYARMGGCSNCNDYHTGWAAEGETLIDTDMSFEALGAKYGRLDDVVSGLSGAQEHLTKLQLSSGSNPFGEGDEVMISITSKGTGSQPCGVHNGQELHVSSTHFTRLAGVDVDELYIPKGSWVDALASVGLYDSPAAVAGSSHCFVKVSKVLHFRNLVVGDGNLFSSSKSFDYSSPNGGGLIALRVNGQLTMEPNSKISMDGKGFQSKSIHGDSWRGLGSTVSGWNPLIHSMAQGAGSNGQSGGGGAGVVGEGSNSTAGLLGGLPFLPDNNSYPLFRMELGGAGGKGLDGSGDSQVAEAGGGVIFVVAEKFFGATGATISAEGNPSTTSLGGAAGGGSVNVFFKSSQGKLALSAKGGDGSGAGSGAGGGGYIFAGICDINNSGSLSTGSVSWSNEGGLGDMGASNGGNGNSKKIWSRSDEMFRWQCER